MELRLFKNPPVDYRIHPFWFWNGRMDDAQIELQIGEMAKKGLGGFFLCARQGMTVPYLSRIWFDKVRLAVDTAKQHGLGVWLYDEYPYPSGMAGGEVILEHPDAKHRTLVYKSMRVKSGENVKLDLPWGRILSADAVPMDPQTEQSDWMASLDVRDRVGNLQSEPVYQKAGLTAYNQQRFFTYRPIQQLVWNAPEWPHTTWDLHLFLEVEVDDFKYYGTFVDPGHHEAVATFIRLTHQRYKEELGQYFGETIKGMFTDEIGYLGRYPWSARLLRLFEEIHHCDLASMLPALIDKRYPDAARIRYEYFESLHLLLRETYHRQVHDWCEENGLQYVAEVPSMRMSTQLYSHVIGSDSAHDKLGRGLPWVIDRYSSNFRSNPKMTSSLARQLGRDRALVESFHSVGWSMTLQDARWMVDRMAAMGVNFFNFHAFFYTLNGLTKHDAPPSQFLQNPYWPYYRQLGDYVGRLGYIMSQGTTLSRIAVLDPTTSLWTHLGNPLHGFNYIGQDEEERAFLEELKSDWTEIGKMLLLHHHEYDHLDPELLGKSEIEEGIICVGRARYSVLILPPMTNLEAAAWRKIHEFAVQGGVVVGVGLVPSEPIEDDGPSIREVLNMFRLENAPAYGGAPRCMGPNWPATKDAQYVKGRRNTYFVPKTTKNVMVGELLRLLDTVAPSPIHLGDDSAVGEFLSQYRTLGQSHIVFLSNQQGNTWTIPVYIKVDDFPFACEVSRNWTVRILDLETGDARPITFEYRDNAIIVSLKFAPYESVLLECVPQTATEAGNEMEDSFDRIEPSAGGPWTVRHQEKNIIRFGTFRLTLTPDNEDSPSTLVRAKTFIDQCMDICNDQSIPLSFHQTFGTPMKVGVSYPIRCVYAMTFHVDALPSVCDLVMDEGAIRGDYILYVNHHPISPRDFRSDFLYDHMNVAVSVDHLLREGENEIRVELTVANDWDGVVDPLYLRGNFGVSFNSDEVPSITLQPTIGTLHGGPHEGYPYYSGTLAFEKTFELDSLPTTSKFTLLFSDWDPNFHDCAEVRVNGRTLGTRVWSPYCWIGESSQLNSGTNTIEVRVTNTLVQTLEGRYFDYVNHELRTLGEPNRQGK